MQNSILPHKFGNMQQIKTSSIVKCHKHKSIKFKQQYQTQSETSQMKVNKHIINNFSTFVLPIEEITAVPYNVDSNSINTEFELFHQKFPSTRKNIITNQDKISLYL